MKYKKWINVDLIAGGSDGKKRSAWETQVQSLGWKDPLEKGMVTNSSILAWRIPQRSLVGYSPWDRKEWDTTERLTFSLFKKLLSCVTRKKFFFFADKKNTRQLFESLIRKTGKNTSHVLRKIDHWLSFGRKKKKIYSYLISDWKVNSKWIEAL